MIKLGSKEVTKVMKGSQEISAVYKGSTEVWTSVPPAPPGLVEFAVISGGGGVYAQSFNATYLNAIGGGGAGGMLEWKDIQLAVGQTYTVTIGAGSNGQGGKSWFIDRNTYTCVGGGGTLTYGGSGGGEMGVKNVPSGTYGGGPGVPGQGHDGSLGASGGVNNSQTAGGGGGGAGAKGTKGQCTADLAIGGQGGAGRWTTIQGYRENLAGGGAGGALSYNGGTSVRGIGLSGGGSGGMDGTPASDGAANTGGGSGGPANKNNSSPDVFGGSGIVIISSSSKAKGWTGNCREIPAANGRYVYEFKSTGSITI